MKELLLYFPLYDFLISPFIEDLDTVNGDYVVRMSSPGGEILPSWGVAKKVRELSEKGFKGTLKIDGMSASMAGVLAPFFDTVEAVDKAKFLIHAPWGGDPVLLKSVSKDLLNVFKARIDADKFKEIVGSTIEEILDPESVKARDVWLDANQALAIKLIDKVVPLTPAVKNEMESKMMAFYGFHEPQNNTSMANTAENNKFSFKSETELFAFMKEKFGIEPSNSTGAQPDQKEEDDKFSFKTESAFASWLKKTFNITAPVKKEETETTEATPEVPANSAELTQKTEELKLKEEEIKALNLQVEALKKSPGATHTKPAVKTDGEGGGAPEDSSFKTYAAAKATWDAVAGLTD